MEYLLELAPSGQGEVTWRQVEGPRTQSALHRHRRRATRPSRKPAGDTLIFVLNLLDSMLFQLASPWRSRED